MATSTPKPTREKAPTSRKYGPKASASVARELAELKAGTLASGSGRKVTTRKQAIAIGPSQARRAGAKVPPKQNDGETAG